MDARCVGHRSSSRFGIVGALALAASLLVPFGSRVAGQVLTTPGGEATTEAATQEAILKVSREWFTAFMNADREALLRLETDDFLMVQRTPTGVAVVARESQLSTLARSPDRPRYERDLLNVKVRRYGTVAVLTALARFRGRVDDKPVVSQAVLTEVWVSESGGWRLANFQATDVPVAPTR